VASRTAYRLKPLCAVADAGIGIVDEPGEILRGEQSLERVAMIVQ
jgi:hypothetical protein